MTPVTSQVATDLSQVVLRLRDDLAIVPQTIGGERLYVIEDRLTGKCYRLGCDEYTVASALDGKRGLAEIVADLRDRPESFNAAPKLEPQAALRVCKWLLQNGLAQAVGEHRDAPAGSKAMPWWSRLNPLFIRVPLLAPDRLLERMRPWAGWINSRVTVLAAGLLALVAAGHLFTDWQRFTVSAGRILVVEQSFYLLLCWMVLKLVHEIGHGLACKHHGGYVREAGVAFLLFAPIPYVDVTSSWRLRSKWARIHIAAAGMYAEGIIGSIAVLIWSYTRDGVMNQLCLNVVVMATATTILFNANPLMRFDGYYMLADWLEIPNLYSRGQQFTTRLFQAWVLGVPQAERPLSSKPHAARIIKAYGLAAWVWRMTVCVSLICAASMLFHGAGIVLAVLAVISWFLAPLGRFAIRLLQRENRPQLRRLCLVTVVAAGIASLFLAVTPAPFPRRSPGVIEYKPITVVRSGSAGFVREILVSPGQMIEAGEVIARLENPTLLEELRSIDLAIQESELHSRWQRQRGEMAAFQAEQDKLAAFQTRLRAKQQQVDRLVVRAPAAGQVIGRTLPLLLDTYLREGDELCRIGQEGDKEVQLSIHQDDVQAFQEKLGAQVAIRGPQGVLYADLTSITPRATDLPTHPALCSSHGGPLPIRTDRHQDAADGMRLLEPRFVGHVTLPAAASARLRAGQLCTVSIRSPHDTMGRAMARQAQAWIARKLR